MKRFFILASAAIVALASCAKTEVVYKDSTPKEIAFCQVAGPMTKESAVMENTVEMGVFAHTVASTPAEYFGNTKFAYNTDSWKASPALYYPIQGELDFAYYAPYATGWTWNGSTTMESPVLNDIRNTDVLYGKNIARSAKTANPLDVELGHALAKVTVNVLTDDNSAGHITINSIKLTNAHTSGKLTVSYSERSLSDVVWSNTTTPSEVTWNVSMQLQTASQLYGTSFIIAEYDVNHSGTEYEQGTLTINYTMDKDGSGAGEATYTGEATFDLAPDAGKTYWYTGNNYIYNIKATLTEITFAPKVELLTNVNTTTDPIVL